MNSDGATVGKSRGTANFPILALVAGCLLAGCGGSSSGSNLGPAGKFIGRWSLDTINTTFGITCTQGSGSVNFWSELDFEHGVLSDVSETSPTCLAPGLALDVDSSGAVLGISNPDPYTGQTPLCSIGLGADANGLTVYLDLTVTAFDFTLLAPVKNKAPTALLSITATGAIVQDDGTGMGNYVQSDTCSYSGTNDTYHRMSQP
jgi:hypothetical protein